MLDINLSVVAIVLFTKFYIYDLYHHIFLPDVLNGHLK